MSETAAGDLSQRLSVERAIHASAADIYALVCDPAGHVRIDGSGMLVEAPDARPVTAVGDTFAMEMDREPLGDLPMGRYAVLNTVTAIEPGRLVEWTVGTEGRTPIGHVYGFVLESVDAVTTKVTSYCDWSGLHPKLVGKIAFPVVPASMMEQTLDRLAALF
ncbi:MAG: hypothetical protein JWR20_872 [Marmoricola sp.]|nr:hypothetical protein [Marmoricola sp.]